MQSRKEMQRRKEDQRVCLCVVETERHEKENLIRLCVGLPATEADICEQMSQKERRKKRKVEATDGLSVCLFSFFSSLSLCPNDLEEKHTLAGIASFYAISARNFFSVLPGLLL
mmetsp:Transcript_12962/g.25339  ORF Transcript_12962/g.25339 Transcript_12962/m.25339 type:complete len:114 (+) Transcript_12962:501-842(+)